MPRPWPRWRSSPATDRRGSGRSGTPEAPGSTLVTVSGAVRTPGVVEVELGTPVADVGGPGRTDRRRGRYLVGGYGGAWLDPSRLATPFAPGPLAAAGATLGVGILVALPTTSCGIAETARIARYMAGESAGQCGPCVYGLPAVADDLELLWAGRADATRPRPASSSVCGQSTDGAPAATPTAWSDWCAPPSRCSPTTPGPMPPADPAPGTRHRRC